MWKDLRGVRQRTRGLLRELSSRTKPLSAALRARQSPDVRRVAGRFALGLVVLLAMLSLWPDSTMPVRFVVGYQSIEALEETRIWDRVDMPPEGPEEDMYPAFEANKRKLMERPIPEEAQFLWDSCLDEAKRKVAERPVTEAVMDEIYGKGNWTALPCFCHVQACGKKRRIDNAKAQLSNAATRYRERFRLASAFAPALAAKALYAAALELGLPPAAVASLLTLESGGEDMPDAFRSIPVKPEHRKHNNVMLRHPQKGYLRFVQALAALFGQGSAFFNFERWSAFLEAVPRRLLSLLWAMYVDDGQLTEPSASKGAGQELIHALFKEIGAGL